MITSRRKWLLPLLITASCFLGALSARADLFTALVPGSDLARWSAFSLGGNIVTDDSVSQVGTTDIYGDVGVAGNGNLSMTGNSTIHGDLYYRSNGTLTMKGASQITGAKHHNAASDSILDNGVTEAIATSNAANSLVANRPNTNITSTTTLTGAPGETVVLKLTNFTLNGGTLTLQGTTTTRFVINVSSQFSLGSHSQIVLSGGVAWDNVLFNVRGSGSDVTIGAQSIVRGILMANNRTVSMDGGTQVLGSVIANKLTMKGGSQINRPPITSP